MTTEHTTQTEPRHLRRIGIIWIVASIIGDLLYWFLVGPHVPPGRMTSSATSDQLDFNILMELALPVLFGIWVFFGYCFVTWRSKRRGVAEPTGGAAAR